MRESIGEITNQASSGEQDRADRRNKARVERRRRMIGGSILAAGLAAVALVINSEQRSPDCHGRQAIPVVKGDTLEGLKQTEVNVPDGEYVDLAAVSVSVLRQGSEVDTTSLSEGDTVIMPTVCE